ncbi:SDR family NAD(P)-dependent oxidoreductase [Nucisporomicrobium flavum]|uniref:SDR family NAD(P)-dependent oxidoreductase n=1 Tax=Nucisporomicrobium flavum TaxID=2785915 RepID=UPI003C2CDDA3
MSVIVVGAGPGIGLATARRFAREGHPIGLVARTEARLARHAQELRGEGAEVEWAAADAQDPQALRTAVRDLAGRLGPAGVLAYVPLPDVATIKPVGETTGEDVARALALGVTGAVAATEAVLPAMLERGRGTLLYTTGSAAVNPSPERATSAVANAAETTYVRLLHEALTPRGLRVAQLTIVGAVGAGLEHEPATVADRLWELHSAPGEALTVLP